MLMCTDLTLWLSRSTNTLTKFINYRMSVLLVLNGGNVHCRNINLLN